MLLHPWFLSALVLVTLEVSSATSMRLLLAWTCFCVRVPSAPPVRETMWSVHTVEWVIQSLWFTSLLARISESLGQRKVEWLNEHICLWKKQRNCLISNESCENQAIHNEKVLARICDKHVGTYRFYLQGWLLQASSSKIAEKMIDVQDIKVIQLESPQRRMGILCGWMFSGAIRFWDRQMLGGIEVLHPLLPLPYLLCDC